MYKMKSKSLIWFVAGVLLMLVLVQGVQADGYDLVTQWSTSHSPWGVAQGPDGIYVADPVANSVTVFNSATGAIIRQFPATAAWGIAVDSDGNIYTAEGQMIEKYNSAGVVQWSYVKSELQGAEGIAVDSFGHVYVANWFFNQVTKFDSDGSFIASYGGSGSGNGFLNQPHGIAVDSSRNNIFVADFGNDRVQKFNLAGTYLDQWYVNDPEGVAVDGSGDVYVTTPYWFGKYVGNTNGHVTGDLLQQTGPPINFIGASGIAVDSAGYVYVGDNNGPRIQKFSYPTTGSLDFSSSPTSAQIWIDDSYTLKITPNTITGLSPGYHQVTFKLPGHYDYKFTALVMEGWTLHLPIYSMVQKVNAYFGSDKTSGPAPLTVGFTDASPGGPTGWAWFFGDETWTAPWTQVTTGTIWSARYDHTAVAMPDGSIVVMGGLDNSETLKNDVWRSTNFGASWTQLPNAGWSARADYSSVVTPDGNIIVMGGTGLTNDVWQSTDNGATWTNRKPNDGNGWSGRNEHSSVALPDGSIVVMGGYDGSNAKNDVWRSTNNGANWVEMTTNAGWSARADLSSVAMPDGSIVVMGGYDGSFKNDVWRSTDNGATWTQIKLNDANGWSARGEFSSVAMPDGSIVVMGGSFMNDVWRSTDNGATWTLMTASPGWTPRHLSSAVAARDGSIVLMGGDDTVPGPGNYKNDVWRFPLVGSSDPNPSHTYTTPGVYNVALQAFNTVGYSSKRETGYITVTGFTDDFTSGFGNWNLYGSPSPVILPSIVGRTGVFDNNGDSWCDSGVVTKNLLFTQPGEIIESDVYLQVPDWTGCFASSEVSITQDKDPYWSHPNCPGEGYYDGASIRLAGIGDGCGSTLPAYQNHAYVQCSILAEDGTSDGNGYEFVADSYINGWHTLKMVIDNDRYVSCYIDNTFVYKSLKKIDPTILQGKRLQLGRRSLGTSLGKAYHDNIKLKLGTVSTGPSTPAPTVTSINPNTGVNTGPVAITSLAGTNFAPGAAAMFTPVNVNPVHKSSLSNDVGGAIIHNPTDIYVSENYAYIINTDPVDPLASSLEIVDVTNPAIPVHRGSIINGDGGALMFHPTDIYVSGNYAYVVSSSFALEIIDVTIPAAPVHKGSLSDHAGGALLDSPTSVYVAGNYAYVTSGGDDALEIVDVTIPAAPVHKGSIINGAGGALLDIPKDVYVSGNYAYVTSDSNALEIIDVTNRAAPVHKGSLSNGIGGALLFFPGGIYVAGNYAYILSMGSPLALEIVDVSDPAAPVHKGSIINGAGGALLNRPLDIYVSGNYAYVASYWSNALEIIDVTIPAAPVHKGSIVNGAGGAFLYQPMSVYVPYGNYAYMVGDSNVLEIVDIGTITGNGVVTPTLITGTAYLTGRAAGSYNVVVVNPDGSFGTLPGGFTVTDPPLVITKPDAVTYGVTNYLNTGTPDEIAEKELLVSDVPVPANTIVTLLNGDTITAPAYPSWLVFINEDKNANWEHPAKIVFVGDGATKVDAVMMPPADIALSHGAGNVPYSDGLTSILPPFAIDPACTPVSTHNYALLISGGGASLTNYGRYYNDIQFMYKTLVNDYKYPIANIKVLMSDGTSTTADKIGSYTGTIPNYVNSDPNLDGKGISRVDGIANHANVDLALDSYAPGGSSALDAGDTLFIFTTGHGASNTNPSYTDSNTNQVDLLLWGTGEKISDLDFNAKLPTLPKIIMMMEQCNGGGFINNVIPSSGTQTRVLATAAKGNEASHSNDFSYYWITGTAGHDSAGNTANADLLNVDWRVSMREAYEYANARDPSGPKAANVETPQFGEYAVGSGSTQFLSSCAETTPTITVNMPVTTPVNTWVKGTKYTVKWTPANLPTSPATYLKIELMKGTGSGEKQADISKSVLATLGTTGVGYTVPTTLPRGAGNDYWIKISTIGIIPTTVGQSTPFSITGVTVPTTLGTLIVKAKVAAGTAVDATVYMSDVIRGTTGNTGLTLGSLVPLTYPVYVTKVGYYPAATVQVVVPSGSYTQTFTMIPLAEGDKGVNGVYGSIAVTSVPKEGFDVWLDDVFMGYGTPVIQDISPGTHKVTLKAFGYKEQDKYVTVVNGEQVRADFTLEPETWLYSFEGFTSPIDMQPVVNSVKAGQTIPVKWHLTNKDGNVADTGSFVNLRSYLVGCNEFTGNPESAVEELSSGSSGLQYIGDGNWQYNWKTDKTYAGKCRNIYVDFKEGQKSPEASFKFTK